MNKIREFAERHADSLEKIHKEKALEVAENNLRVIKFMNKANSTKVPDDVVYRAKRVLAILKERQKNVHRHADEATSRQDQRR